MKFLCDEMLQRFGSWLRAAGYDTKIISDGRNDYDVIKLARKENRILLTCDRALTQYRDAEKNVVLLTSGSLDELAKQTSQKCHVNWKLHPFSRCLTCNSDLIEASEAQRKTLPSDIVQSENSHDIYYCANCNKIYWDGDHARRMREQLEKWNAAYTAAE